MMMPLKTNINHYKAKLQICRLKNRTAYFRCILAFLQGLPATKAECAYAIRLFKRDLNKKKPAAIGAGAPMRLARIARILAILRRYAPSLPTYFPGVKTDTPAAIS